MVDVATTLLAIAGIDIPPYSARALTQTLEPIDAAANLRRTINATLVDVSASQFRKFKSTVTCSDHQAPALNGVWPGLQVTVDCVSELSYKTVGGAAARTVVPGSAYVDGAYTFYRPRITMRVMSYTTTKDEYGAGTGWALQLEEV